MDLLSTAPAGKEKGNNSFTTHNSFNPLASPFKSLQLPDKHFITWFVYEYLFLKESHLKCPKIELVFF